MAEKWDEEYDVVVVGSGGGALTGAYLTAVAGLETVVVEKTPRLGGMSAYSGAALWLPGSPVQKRDGVPDSTESARTYLRALLGDGTAGKQDAFLAEAPRLVARLENDPAIAFRFREFPDYYERPGRVPGGRSFVPADLDPGDLGELLSLVRPPVDSDRTGQEHDESAPLTAGRALIGRLLLAYDRTGHGTVRTRTRMDQLVTTHERVTGIVATRHGRRVRIGARRGVLLAGGGFEHNERLRSIHGVPGSAGCSMAPTVTNTGEPVLAATAIGADTDLMHEGWWCPGLMMPDGQPAFVCGFFGGLVVDAHGSRYANESLPYDRFGREMAQEPSRTPSYVIFDDRTAGAIPAVMLPPWGDPAAHLASGTLTKADSPEQLARLIGVPADRLAAAVERFNGFADKGQDEEFGRESDEYGHWFGEPVLRPVRKAPFYAARLVLADLGTKGGLVTDTSARVLRADRTPIAGLYAAGNTSASFTGAFYPGPGIPIGTAMVFGSLAAKDMTG
ncbi:MULTISPECIES: FAD-binding protein [unclassified Streptomyces]|uniref:FAD-binding protein n=1 Tax=unclassified Streptomyces TaxID=2593676 RepID=UPI00224D35C0|nr:FAD-binding protein [Streptomyces sp. NBC_01306]MCX4729039.1 FAD-binding protein [Streptomyces sp. NBC_01306]WSX65679.1 FAD-binding protein [Streptomyces sp. NBC_00932]